MADLAEELRAIQVALALLAATVYATVGVVVGRRAVSVDGRVANRAFQLWWFGLASFSLQAPLHRLMDSLASPTAAAPGGAFVARLAILVTLVVVLVLAVAGLVYYLLYVYTGRPGIAWPVGAYHAGVLACIMVLLIWAHPVSYGPVAGSAADCVAGAICYENRITGTPASQVVAILLLAPILVSAVAYLALYFRVESREQRYRIAVVSGALVLWFGSSLAAQVMRGTFETAGGKLASATLAQSLAWSHVIGPLIGLAASLAILFAYRPPAPIRRRLAAPARSSA